VKFLVISRNYEYLLTVISLHEITNPNPNPYSTPTLNLTLTKHFTKSLITENYCNIHILRYWM